MCFVGVLVQSESGLHPEEDPDEDEDDGADDQ
jgi:hypothetical protein|eukprot:CAMPEP_0174315870 /NCGR_PEP_ID=MMETSP0810-20121108/6566_1 /TAXON_ID=73025 ORGANISM="Eutreptiella gymnastica-like, Strain CCMP1594" /NCGR_SAMPLE_ID=MMETSP0810 /ASSEMBLY_ACC=CAM_ASM_000659 /LENGTH=31 /DNA_ID= /DNA_START= /DNA_END= /DNA_ORIENTATION=